MTKLTHAAIRDALRAKRNRQEISAYRITSRGEIHVCNHVVAGSVRRGWTLYAYVDAPELGYMLGLERDEYDHSTELPANCYAA